MVKLWDVASAQEKGILQRHTQAVWSVAFSPDGKTLASASSDRTIKLWDVAAGTVRGILMGHNDQVGALAYSPDGQILASGGDDSTIRLWPVASRRSTENGSGE